MDDVVSAAAFSAMRGHVNDGQRVKLRSGQMLRVTATMRGWTLIDVATGRRAMDDSQAGAAVEAAVCELDREAA